jgi:hypothetical protein
MTGDNDGITCIITSGTLIEIYRAEAGSLTKEITFTSPVRVNRYFDQRTMGVLIGKSGDDNIDVVYGVTNGRWGVPLIIPWFEIDTQPIPEILYTPEQRISIFYKKLGAWYSSEIDENGNFVKTDKLPQLHDNAEVLFISGEKIPGIYFTGRNNESDNRSNNIGDSYITKYRLKKSEWTPELNLSIPVDINQNCTISSQINNRIFLVFSVRDGLSLYRIED